MSLLSKISILSVVAASASSLSFGAIAVELGVDPARPYAAELVDGTTLVDAGDIATIAVGYNFSDGEVRHGRFECTSNMTMAAAALSTASPDLSLGAVNGEGASVLFFSITAGAAVGTTADDVLVIDATNTLVANGAVDCAFSIYDQPSQAQSGGEAGRVHATGWHPFLSRPSGFVFAPDPADQMQAIADVEADGGPYFDFVATPAVFANLQFAAVPGVLDAGGGQVTLAEIFHPTTRLRLEGEFAVADEVLLFNHQDATWHEADDLAADAAIFTGFSVDVDADFHFQPNMEEAIPESLYTATLEPVTNAGFAAEATGPVLIGEIVHNGTELQMPLVNVPGGWLSRIALTNTSNLVRPYTLDVMGEPGNAIDLNTTMLAGSLAPRSTTLIDLNEVLQWFSGKARATINITVAAPDHQIQGQYQIVNAATGATANSVLVRPASN